VALAVIHEENEDGDMVWNTYLLNLKKKELEGVMVSSKGYGDLNGEKKETSVLRHFLENLPGESYVKIELIIEEVFGMFNEYWLSFRQDGMMYDKKYIFVPESISEEHCMEVPLINKRGVMMI